jgi:hypothetical protein
MENPKVELALQSDDLAVVDDAWLAVEGMLDQGDVDNAVGLASKLVKNGKGLDRKSTRLNSSHLRT